MHFEGARSMVVPDPPRHGEQRQTERSSSQSLLAAQSRLYLVSRRWGLLFNAGLCADQLPALTA